jgi:TldD protein
MMANSTCSYIASEAFGFDDGRLKTADYSRDAGFGLRGVSGEMTGFAHANDISAAAIRRAGETLALLDPAMGPRPERRERSNRHLYTDASPLDAVHFAAKVRLLETIDAAARARDPRVSQVASSLSGSWSVVEIVRADGFVATDIRPLVRLNVAIVAETTAAARPALRHGRAQALRRAVRAGATGTARSTTALARRWSTSRASLRRPAR